MKFTNMSLAVWAEQSLPSRERGLKSDYVLILRSGNLVAPFAGAWIEINEMFKDWTLNKVAPFAGAWIEMLRH